MDLASFGRSRRGAAVLLSAAFLVAGAGAARAVSGGGYSPSEQDCSPSAESNAKKQNPEPGCHNLKLNVEDGKGNRYAEAGVDQMPDGPSTPGLFGVGYPGADNFPNAGCAAVNTDGTGGGPGTGCGSNPSGAGASAAGSAYDPQSGSLNPSTGTGTGITRVATDGVNLYFGADDNLDAGEHDGVDPADPNTGEAVNGPSDGGAITGHVTPAAATETPSLSNPVPVAGAAFGFCADGICIEVTTFRQVIYQGGGGAEGSKESRDAANYDQKNFDPYDCTSGSAREEDACAADGKSNMNDWRRDEAKNVYAEPGVQVYEDPDPQTSPIDPVKETGINGDDPVLYPLPGVYAGTCGVVAGTPVAPAPDSPVTNHAGQVAVGTGC